MGTFQGDLGISLYTQRPISDDLLGRLPATLELTFVSVLISAIHWCPV